MARCMSCYEQEWNPDDIDFKVQGISRKESNKVSSLKAVSKNVVIWALTPSSARQINLYLLLSKGTHSHRILGKSPEPLRIARILQEALAQINLRSIRHKRCFTDVTHAQKHIYTQSLTRPILAADWRDYKQCCKTEKAPLFNSRSTGKLCSNVSFWEREHCWRPNSRRKAPWRVCLAVTLNSLKAVCLCCSQVNSY